MIEDAKFSQLRMMQVIHEEMKIKNISVKRMADEIGVCSKTLVNWIHGRKNCPVYAMLYMCDVLGVNCYLERI